MNDRRTVLITGASGGIGYELAKLFARDHYDLVLVARSGPKLREFGAELERQFKVSVKSVTLDLSAASASQSLWDQLQRDKVVVDVLVNNAGYGIRDEFVDIPIEESLGQIQLNVTALTALSRLFLPPMLERRSGKILNVASTAGFQPGPGMAVYYATKAYVISFSEALAYEVKDQGVTVTCLCPGVTDTGFQKRANTEASRLFKAVRPMDAATVALGGYQALMSGKSIVITGTRNWLLAEAVRFAPRRLVTAVSHRVMKSD
jgi:short-subunit dehydrogenase